MFSYVFVGQTQVFPTKTDSNPDKQLKQLVDVKEQFPQGATQGWQINPPLS